MNRIVTFVEVSNARERLAKAQRLLRQSIESLALFPLAHPGGGGMTRFGAVLAAGRLAADGAAAFVWCNSDVILTRSPFDVPNPSIVYGFHRREVPSGEVNRGVDMYYIPVRWWDEYLSKDIPPLWLGASYVDRWISRAMEKVGAYANLEGYIDHPSHAQSAASGSDANRYYQENFLAYNKWARRHGLDPISAPPFLIPGIGHVWGLRDALNKAMLRARKGKM